MILDGVNRFYRFYGFCRFCRFRFCRFRFCKSGNEPVEAVEPNLWNRSNLQNL
jgi:hypothetical protein